VEAFEGGDRGVDLDDDCQKSESELSSTEVERRTIVALFSADWMISGVAPTDAPGTMLPSSQIAVASMIAQSKGYLGCKVRVSVI
jgi:hypothetical protein